MQNKGLIKLFAVLLTLICLFYLSFSFVTNYQLSKAERLNTINGKLDENLYKQYMDSLQSEKVWLGYTFKECRTKEVALGLDLKGGMNVIMEVSVADILRALSGNNTDANFNKALVMAADKQKSSTKDFLDLFAESYAQLDPNAKLSVIFSTFDLKDKIRLDASNNEVLAVLRKEISGAIDNSFNVLRNRIDRFGVVQPNIQRLETAGRILIELPGIKEPERVRKLLQGTANLEFWETYNLPEIYQNLIAANNVIRDLHLAPEVDTTALNTASIRKDSLISQIDSLKTLAKTAAADTLTPAQQRARMAKDYPLLSILSLNQQDGSLITGPIVGTSLATDTAQVNHYLALKQVREVLPRNLQLRWTVKAVDKKDQYYQLVAIKVTNRDGRAALEGDVITDARDDFGQGSAYANVSMSMNADGTKTWARLTKENLGRCIAIVLDNYVYSYPRVNVEIPNGNSQITGNFTPEEAIDLANTLKSGKMPAPARIVQEDVIGPSLGAEAIRDGFISFAIAFVLIMIYMVFYYGWKPGLVADFALLANLFFLMGVLVAWGATLTLPGIAGIVLTLGMAVDANVLIYERIREEKDSGKNVRKAVEDGFKNAFSAILDSNITTLLTGVILAYFGTGPIKGFATTLIIGIITSFLTAVFLTRIILERFAAKDKLENVPFTTRFTKNWFQGLHLNFIGRRRIGYIISAVCMLVFIVSLATNGLSSGIDFSGGRNYTVRFNQPVSTAEVLDALQPQFGNEIALNVITIGSDNQVRISTNYKVDDSSEGVDAEIESKLYEGLKAYVAGSDLETFKTQNIQSSTRVGPTIANDIKTNAIWAVIFAIIGIGLYILYRFKDLAFSVGSVVSLAHDAVFVVGSYSLLYKFMPFSMELNQDFIAAVLTVVGYSINDTVVIFDRIRENIGLHPKRDRAWIMNESINATMSRTFSTSFTVLIVLFVIFFFGGDVIRGFIFALLIGVGAGVYSTVFIASPVAYDFSRLRGNKKAVEGKK